MDSRVKGVLCLRVIQALLLAVMILSVDCTWLLSSCSADANWALPVVPSATERFALALDRACKSIGLRPWEITLSDDYLPKDDLQLPLYDRWMKAPLAFPGEMDAHCRRMLSGDWMQKLAEAYTLGNFPRSSESVAAPELALEDAFALLWERSWPRVPVARRRTIQSLQRNLSPEALQWLTRLLQLQGQLLEIEHQVLGDLSQEEIMQLRLFLQRVFMDDLEDQEDLKEAEIERMLELTRLVPWREYLQSLSGVFPQLQRLLATPLPQKQTEEELTGVLLDWQTPQGRLIVGGVDSQVYELDSEGHLLILDLGGDDVYRTNASGREPGMFTLVIDLDGQDEYEARSPLGFGATLGGFSILYDAAGDDRYRGKSLNFGAGLMGIGILLDSDGNDFYQCDLGALGVGYAGLGLLVDLSGNDQYLGHGGVQGVGAPGGVGVLLDGAGDDLYIAGNARQDRIERKPRGYINFSQGFGFGMRPYCSGGIGVLLDGSGEDRYLSSYFAQGSSYWLGVGVLYDGQGNDSYETVRYSQGAGIHLGLGLLLDHDGHDVYNAWGVSQGCGHDLAVGILWDSAGNDLYRGSWLFGGAGNANGIGFLVDAEGNDFYVPSTIERPQDPRSLGWGEYMEGRDLDSLGFLLDLAGEDYLGDLPLKQPHRIKSDVGVLINFPDDLDGWEF